MSSPTLPPGITSFSDKIFPSTVQLKVFQAACHQLARHLSGEVGTVKAAGPGRSYHAIDVKSRGLHISILSNVIYPFTCFVPAGTYGFTTLDFQDPTLIIEDSSPLGKFQPVRLDFLLAELTTELLTELMPEERAQLDYWRSRGCVNRVGDVIFNAWD